jgi:hypothetical protein
MPAPLIPVVDLVAGGVTDRAGLRRFHPGVLEH